MNTLKVICEDKESLEFNLQKVADLAYETLGQKERLLIEVAFVSEEEIREINKEQRNIDSVTDVLSFPYLDGIKGEVLTPAHFGEESEEDGFLLGSICICLQRAKEQAVEFGHSLEREVCFLALHGVLHCFGYDHIEKADETEMMGIAEKIMEKLNLKRTY
ncbi:MAG: rRNA maturation RNase YbeY [Clostridia bacterium]|nr:rRNA maturation RNase YbeY [Clostridia bacterium]